MAVLGRLLVSSAERIDLADLLSIDSFSGGDWKSFFKGLIADDQPYILKGFDAIDPEDSIGAQNISIRVADSVVFYPGSTAGSFFVGLEEGNEHATPLVPELRKNATNYVYLTLSTFETARDTRAFWDPDKDGGAGGEFTQDINTESVLKADVNVSVGSYPENTIPICKVVVGPSVITAIEDNRDLMFRLGTGGLNADVLHRHDFRSLPEAAYQREEPAISITSAADPNPFQGADKNIYTLKEWMDTVMTKLAELGGSTFWYEDISTFSLVSLWGDALGTTIKSKGQWKHDTTTPGLLEFTEDIQIQSVIGPRDVIVRAGSKTLADEEVMYLNLVREEPINGFSIDVTFINGLNYIDGVIGSFANLNKGDYIKKDSDSDELWLRVDEFYADIALGGGTTTAALAKSVRLNENYAGSSETIAAVYTKGIYSISDVQVSDRQSAALSAAGGDMYWLAMRSDTVQAVSNITTNTLISDITEADGETAKMVVVAHGLEDGEQITIAGSASYDGTYEVEVEDANTFYIRTTTTGGELSVSAYVAVATTVARDNGFGVQLESAAHNFETKHMIRVSDTASAFNGDYTVFVRSDTTFSFPVGSSIPSVTTGLAMLARMNVRSESGIDKVIRGEIRNVGATEAEATLRFIGMAHPAQETPIYAVPTDYNALNGYENFNSSTSDNLTQRVSKLTAMMGDRVQDRGIQFIGPVTLLNESSGGGQTITGGTLVIEKPGSPQQVIDVTSILPADSAATITINRDGNAALTTNIESLNSPYLLEENKIILFYRFTNTDVFAWDGDVIANNGTRTMGNSETSQNRNITVFSPTFVNLDVASDEVTFQDDTVDITVIVHGSNDNNTLDTSAINALGTFILPDGYAAWVRVNREAAKIFNTISAVDAPDTDANGMLYITQDDEVPVDQDVFVLYTRVGESLLKVNHALGPEDNVYEEFLTVLAGGAATDNEINGPVPINTIITIPFDSRAADSVQKYIVNAAFLEVFLNGQFLHMDSDWEEVGVAGTGSSQIKILQQLEIGDLLTFRIDTAGSVFFTSVGGGGGIGDSLQTAYDNGRTILTNSGQPIVINGPGGEKLIVINGDMKVTGVIDPTGLVFDKQALDPLNPTDHGLYVNFAGDLIQRRGTDPDINLSAGGINLIAGPGIDIQQVGNTYTISAIGAGLEPYFLNYVTGATGLTVSTGDNYNQGTNKLSVYRNGLYMNLAVMGGPMDQYLEASMNTVSLTSVAGAPEVFAFINEDVTSQRTYLTSQTGTLLTVPSYTMGNDSLRIFKNGVLMNTAGFGGLHDQYSETSPSTITLAQAAVASDVFAVYNSSVPTFREDLTGQTGVTITLSAPYTMGDQKLLVYRNGILMLNSLSLAGAIDRYQETGVTTIQLETAATAGEVFSFIYK